MSNALINLTSDGHRDAAGWLRVHLTNDMAGKLAIAKHCDPNDLVESITFEAVRLLVAGGDAPTQLARIADGMDLGQPNEQATSVGLLLLTARGNREAIAWLKVHLAFDAEAKAQLASQAHAQDLCESLTAIVLTLLGPGVAGPPLDYIAGMINEANQLDDDSAA